MSVTLQSIARENGSGCSHLIITGDDNGVSRTVHISQDDIVNGLIADANYKLNIILLWIRYQILENNKTPAQIVGMLPQVVIS